jgi:hypothetical protein
MAPANSTPVPSGLWSAQDLVAAEGHEVGPCPDRFGDGRLVREAELDQIDQRAAAEILDQR